MTRLCTLLQTPNDATDLGRLRPIVLDPASLLALPDPTRPAFNAYSASALTAWPTARSVPAAPTQLQRRLTSDIGRPRRDARQQAAARTRHDASSHSTNGAATQPCFTWNGISTRPRHPCP